jgi:hypothetical protein
MQKALDHVVDALDIETFLICKSESEGREIALSLMAELNLPQGDIVFIEHKGPGARVRIRTYIHHPGDHYRWLSEESKE